MLKQIEYRPDIDGLRAIAILAILVFHIFPNVLPGGFIGVDIFFVISGYLISAIIISDLNNQTFKFSDFYIRRIKRIFPALLVMLSFVTLFGWFMLFSDEFVELGKHIRAATTFISNFLLYNDRAFGYFDKGADYKPLLHIWSLSVEEQFYILFPIFFFILYKIRHFTVYLLISAVALSFALNIYFITRNPKAAFFFLPTRAWELLLGALLAYLAVIRPSKLNIFDLLHKNTMSIIGLSLIIYSSLSFNEASPFPGWLALLPTLGTVLMICSNNTWLNRNVLSHRWMVWIGLISYPLYLWHWPLISFAHILNDGNVTTKHRIIIFISSFIAAAVTTIVIERPVRKKSWKTIYPLIALMLIILAVAIAIKRNYIAPRSANMSPLLNKIYFSFKDWDYPNKSFETLNHHEYPFNRFGKGEKVTVFFGDSNIEQYWPRVEKLMLESRLLYDAYTVVFVTRGGAMPIATTKSLVTDPEKQRFLEQAIKYIKSPEVHTVVIGAQWWGYLSNGNEQIQDKYRKLEALLLELNTLGKKVYLILNIPIEDTQGASNMIKRHIFKSWKANPAQSYDQKLWLVKSQDITNNLKTIAYNTKAIIIDPAEHLCPNGQCVILDADGYPCYKDATHLSATYVREHITYIDDILAIKQ